MLSSPNRSIFLGLFGAILLIFGTLGFVSSSKAQPLSCVSFLRSTGQKVGERLLGVAKLRQLYEAHPSDVHSPEDFWKKVLEVLDIKLDVIGEIQQIPAQGKPLVVVANHPYGLLDGISLAHLISQRRTDYMVLGNALLSQFPEIRDRLIPVHILKGSREEKRKNFLRNREALKSATEFVRKGGALIAFPSGAVATASSLFGPAVEQDWQTSVAKVILESQASALPVYFPGKNSLLFQSVSQLHPSVRETFRVALLPRELLKQRQGLVRVVLGQEIIFTPSFDNAKDLTEALKERVMSLSTHSSL